MSSEKKFTMLEQPQIRLSNLLSSQSEPPPLLELDSSLSYTSLESHHHHHNHSMSPASITHHHHHQYNTQMNIAMLDTLQVQQSQSLSAPSPPDSSSPVSMSSSPIPPTLMQVTGDRIPDHIVCSQAAEIVQAGYNVPNTQNIHFHQITARTYLRIIEQPTNRIRYRYKSEKGSHGGLTGESSTPTKKTYPTVKLDNVRHTGHYVIKASLVTNEQHPKQHVHKLMGRHCNEDGVCIVQLGENGTAVFQNLGILFVGKKEVPEILYQRKLEEQRMFRPIHSGVGQLSEADNQRLREEAERDAKDMNLNSVRICFEAFDCSQNMSFTICDPVYSRSVANQKSPDSGELKIVRMDKYSGICTGDEEVFLLCEKVNKKEIKVRFFETDAEGNQIWEAFGNFTEADVHHQVAIVFRTPPYRDTDLDDYVQVFLQLYRPKDSEYSEPRPFTYCPRQQQDKPMTSATTFVEVKRKKASPDHDTHSTTRFQPQSTDNLTSFYGQSSLP